MSDEQATNAEILQEIRQIGDKVGQLSGKVEQIGAEVGQLSDKVDQISGEVGQLSAEVGQLKKGQTAIQISIARFDEKFDGVENRFDAMENQIGKVESGVEKLEVAVNGNTTAIARMDGESTAMSALFWTGAAVVVAVVITTIIENKFHWLKDNWGWMFGNKEIRK